MIFKFFNKENEDQEEILTEEQLLEKKIKLTKSLKRRNTIKRVCLTLVIALGVFGGYKSLFSVPVTGTYDEIMDQSFLSTYLNNYYLYPATDQSKQYLSDFSLSEEYFKLEYAHELESSSSSDSTIYNVEVVDPVNNIYSFYVRSNYTIKMKNADSVSSDIYNKVTIAKNDDQYKVVRPVENISNSINTIDDETLLDKYKFETSKGSQSVDENIKSEVQNTISLFLKTYNDNITQARLLVTNPSDLKPLDGNTKLELVNAHSVTSSDDTYYVDCIVSQKYKDQVTTNLGYHFEVNINTNKINTMEVY